MTRIRILATCITGRGTFGADDLLDVDDAFARHLVDDCKAAVYVQQRPAPEPVAAPVRPEPAPRRRRGG